MRRRGSAACLAYAIALSDLAAWRRLEEVMGELA